MATQNNTQSKVKSAMRTLDLIELVIAHKTGVVASEISAALSIPESSLSYLLGTLVERGYLARQGRLYFPGAGLDRLRQPQDEQSLADKAAPIVKALRNQLNETASLFMLTGWEAEAVVTETSRQSLRYSLDVGTRNPLHCIAAGKALLASMPGDQLNRYFDEAERERFTENTLCERKELERELAKTKKQGYARTCDEYTVGISAVGMVVPAAGEGTYSISVAVPTPRFDKDVERKIIDLLAKSADTLGRGGIPA
jgi:IclR family acetate operon transcriptional repressor